MGSHKKVVRADRPTGHDPGRILCENQKWDEVNTMQDAGNGHVRWLDDYCHYCGSQLNSWDSKVSKALGYLKYHCCERCIAKEYDRTIPELRDVMEEYFGMRPCKGI